jgi:hypothetical protein
MQARRARTRRLIELGGLVKKSGLADQLANDRTAIMGALLTGARLLNNANEYFPPTEVIARWREAGRAALSPPHQPNMEPR